MLSMFFLGGASARQVLHFLLKTGHFTKLRDVIEKNKTHKYR